ncbi:Uncharacterised protein [Mycobacteroides abscessus subsp. abscessus]|nr:Uncharacterised protein [Mycobacteroides abscessus subsp. abscessus]
MWSVADLTQYAPAPTTAATNSASAPMAAINRLLLWPLLLITCSP